MTNLVLGVFQEVDCIISTFVVLVRRRSAHFSPVCSNVPWPKCRDSEHNLNPPAVYTWSSPSLPRITHLFVDYYIANPQAHNLSRRGVGIVDLP